MLNASDMIDKSKLSLCASLSSQTQSGKLDPRVKLEGEVNWS